jgi:site-specific recombinase XerD
LECLDRYPDGTARLHLPAGKTKRERIVPLNEAAAVVIQEVQALRKQLAEKEPSFIPSWPFWVMPVPI